MRAQLERTPTRTNPNNAVRSLLDGFGLQLPNPQLLGRGGVATLRHVKLEHFARFVSAADKKRRLASLSFLKRSIETDIRVTLLWRDLSRLRPTRGQMRQAPRLYQNLLRLERAPGLPTLHHSEILTLRASFSDIRPQTEALSEGFFSLLENSYPEVSKLFCQKSSEFLQQRLARTINYVVWHLDKRKSLRAYLVDRGSSLASRGFHREHFCASGECLLHELAILSGDAWTPRVNDAWIKACELSILLLLQGAAKSEEIAACKTLAEGSSVAGSNCQLQKDAADSLGRIVQVPGSGPSS